MFSKKNLFLILSLFFVQLSFSQSLEYSKDFRLGSPNTEPDGRRDVVLLPNGEFVSLSKVMTSSKKHTYALDKFDVAIQSKWSTEIVVDASEEFQEVFFNGIDLILLSTVHLEQQQQTILNAYGYDVTSGVKKWNKELERYTVAAWKENAHKGKVKESFLDVIAEHSTTHETIPFKYKHHLHFSNDGSKFISYVFNYGESNLSANMNVFNQQGEVLAKGKVTIDPDYTNYGIFVNNTGDAFIVNANNGGKLNVIKFNLETKDFSVLELPSNSLKKDDFHIQFLSDQVLLIGNTEVSPTGQLMGVLFSQFDFNTNTVVKSVYKDLDANIKLACAQKRAKNATMKEAENWLDYDLTHFHQYENGQIVFVLEKRLLYSEGYPHIARGVFDESHQVPFEGHVQAESILMLSFNSEGQLGWSFYEPKNQVYPSSDGLNTISFVLDEMQKDQLRILYAYSEGLDASMHHFKFIALDKKTGQILKETLLPNQDKLVLVRDYTLWPAADQLIIVGRKGLLGKTSFIVKYKL
jgi:hypothetical protein